MKKIIERIVVAGFSLASVASAAIFADGTLTTIDFETDIAGSFLARVAGGVDTKYNVAEADQFNARSPFSVNRGNAAFPETFAVQHQFDGGDGSGGDPLLHQNTTRFLADGDQDGSTNDLIGSPQMGVGLGAGGAGNHAFQLSNEGDFANSGLFIRIQNTTGETITRWNFLADYFYEETGGSVSDLDIGIAVDNGTNPNTMSFTPLIPFGITAPVNGDTLGAAAGSFDVFTEPGDVANGDYVVFRFTDEANNTSGSSIYIDNIGIQAVVVAPAPEPSTLGLLFVGIGMLSLRRRYAKTA